MGNAASKSLFGRQDGSPGTAYAPTAPAADSEYEMLPVPPQDGAGSRPLKSADVRVRDAGPAGPAPPLRLPGVWRQWWAEMANCVLMVGMLFAIVGILAAYNGRPLPEWPFAVSINTAVSILSTVLKTCAALILAEGVSDLKWRWFRQFRSLHDIALFDSASRGPWGCLRLLAAPRGFVASLGAALVLLTLAVDPFTQQLIRHYDCKQMRLGGGGGGSDSDQATLPRGTMYTEAAPHVGAGIWPPVTAVLGFIDQGIYNSAEVGKTPFACPTGNCTFEEPFSTLGYCATCEDVSDRLRFVNVTVPGSSLNPTTNKTDHFETLFVNTTLPSGSYAAAGTSNGLESWFAANATADGWYELIQASKAFPGAPTEWRWEHYYASVMRQHKTPADTGCDSAYENNTWACRGFGGAGAARCKLDPCVRTYEARVEGGVLSERLVGSHTDMFVTSSYSYLHWVAADLGCAGPEVVARLRDTGFEIGQDATVIPWNVIVNSSDGTASIWANGMYSGGNNVTVRGPLLNETGLPLDIVPAECIYYAAYPAVSAIQRYLASYLSGAVSPGSNGHSADGPPQLRALYNDSYASFDSIDQAFAGIAEGITQRIRRHAEPGRLPAARPVVGTVWEQKTCVDVRWAFLAFPAAVVGLTAVFLAVLVSRAAFDRYHNISANWKSSPLPLAFHGLTTDGAGLGSVDGGPLDAATLEDMERAAKATKARLNT